jgi:hypothetical protein
MMSSMLSTTTNPLSALRFTPLLQNARLASILYCDTSEYNVTPRKVEQVHVPLQRALALSSGMDVDPVSLGLVEGQKGDELYVYSTPVLRYDVDMRQEEWYSRLQDIGVLFRLMPPLPPVQNAESGLLSWKHEVVCKWTYTDGLGLAMHVVDAVDQTVQDLLWVCFSSEASVTCILHTEFLCHLHPSDEVLLLQNNSATMVTISRHHQGNECPYKPFADLLCSIERFTSTEDPHAWAKLAAGCFDPRLKTKVVRRPAFLREKQLAFLMGTHAKLRKNGCVIPACSFEEALLMKIVDLSEDLLSPTEMLDLIQNYGVLSNPAPLPAAQDDNETTMPLHARLVSARKLWAAALQLLGW